MVLSPQTAPCLQVARVMGIVNATPDSFSDGGAYDPADQALSLIRDGADWLDVGGESTRPGAEPVSETEELQRVLPVIRAIRARWDGPISIDTLKPAVADAAIAAGATAWNDVSALGHPDSPALAARLGCPVFLMHMQGEPRTMQHAPTYMDVVAEVADCLAQRAVKAIRAGVDPGRIWLDPGIGFGKTLAHNLALLQGLPTLSALGYPLLVGASRKRMIVDLDPSATTASARLGGSVAVHLYAARMGAAMVRVHDVRETAQALRVQSALETSLKA